MGMAVVMTGSILSAANAVIQNNPGRRPKSLWSDNGQGKAIQLVRYNDQFEEAEGTARALRERMQAGGKTAYADFAVIIRANAQARPFEDEFMAAKIPYQVVGGQSLFERKEARDVVSYLSLIANPDGELDFSVSIFFILIRIVLKYIFVLFQALRGDGYNQENNCYCFGGDLLGRKPGKTLPKRDHRDWGLLVEFPEWRYYPKQTKMT